MIQQIKRWLMAAVLAGVLTASAATPTATAETSGYWGWVDYLYATAPYPDLQYAIIDCESGWDPGATGALGEQGLAQFYPLYAYDSQEAYGIYGSLYDPYVAIDLFNAYVRDGRIGAWTCYYIVTGQPFPW